MSALPLATDPQFVPGHGQTQAEFDAICVAWAREYQPVFDLDYGLTVSTDMANLHRIYSSEPPHHPPMPMYDPQYEDMKDTAFWLGISKRGVTIGTIGCRLRWVPVQLKKMLKSFILGRNAPQGSSVESSAVDLERIRGNIAVPGVLWVHPDHRGQGLAQALVHLSIVEAYARWKPDWIVSLVRLGDENRVGYEIDGFRRSHKFVTFTDPRWDHLGEEKRIVVLSANCHEVRERYLGMGEGI